MAHRKFVFVIDGDVAGFIMLDDKFEKNKPLLNALASKEFSVTEFPEDMDIQIGDIVTDSGVVFMNRDENE